MQNKRIWYYVLWYYGITSKTFGTDTQNVIRVDFQSSGYFGLPGN